MNLRRRLSIAVVSASLVGLTASAHATLSGSSDSHVTRGKLHLNMTDFGINVPSYLGITVKPDVDVNADFRVAGS